MCLLQRMLNSDTSVSSKCGTSFAFLQRLPDLLAPEFPRGCHAILCSAVSPWVLLGHGSFQYFLCFYGFDRLANFWLGVLQNSLCLGFVVLDCEFWKAGHTNRIQLWSLCVLSIYCTHDSLLLKFAGIT